MSCVTVTAKRRRRLLASSFLVPVLSLGISSLAIYSWGISSAKAQQATTDQLPPIEVSPPRDDNQTRAKPVTDQDSGSRRVNPAGSPPTSSQQTPATDTTTTDATKRVFNGIVGAATTVITAQDIARSPAATLPEIIAQVPGVQLTTLYGGVGGAQQNVDLRGFGAFATANTLLLINGRRVNDVDLQGVDFSTIPIDSIERIEITKGNSGAVLYGDNAIGGVINIVTKTGVGGPPITARVEGGVGSFNQRTGSISFMTNQGAWSSSVFGNAITSDGYRTNNALQQQNGFGELRYTTPDFSAFFNVSGDNQQLGFPGGRLVNPALGINELATDRSGTDTPVDFGNAQGTNATAGFTKTLVNGVDLIVDGGLRDKRQQAGFFGNFPLDPFNASSVNTSLETWSLTPRLKIKNMIAGLPSEILTGIDFYDAGYHSERGEYQSTPPIHTYDLSQQTLAGYWQQTIGLLPSTDFSYGARVQQTTLAARDTLDMSAPGYFGDAQALPLNGQEIDHALHVGIEHRFNDVFSVFARAAQAFLVPNVDERIGSGPLFDPITFAPVVNNFMLKTQTSEDVEGGFRVKAGKFEMQSSIYDMELKNELHFDPVNFVDYNLDPTRRYGSETSATYRATDALQFHGGFAYTRAVFREGPYAGNDIPLVSRYTASGGVSWNIWQKFLVADATVRYWSNRRMDNDQPNTQPLIPAETTVDLKLSGAYDRYFWSLSVNNLFNVQYYDYAIASAFTPGAFSAYPLPGRTYMLKAGATF